MSEPMPEGFTDRTAWDAIHWRFSEGGSVLDAAVFDWQRENPERVRAAIEAELSAVRVSQEPRAAVQGEGTE